jgi:aldose 1-epimerase
MTFEGRQFRFEANNQNNFIHGLVRRRPWKLVGSPAAGEQQAAATLALDWDESQPDFKRFPIKHRLTVTYVLLVDGLEIRYEVHNQDGQRLPYGFGLHPYFRVPGARRDVRLTVPLAQRMEALQMLPTGKLLPVGPERDLRQGRTLLELDLDDVYFGMAPGKRAGIQWRGSNIDLTLEASKEFTHLVVFTPWDRPLFAIENQTSSTDDHNWWGKGFKRESNLLVLQPGARAGGFVRWRLARIQPTTPVVPGERPSDPHARYDQSGSPHLAPLLSEVLRYPTVAGNEQARKHQQAWLKRTGEGLKFTVRDAGLVTEIELPASPTAVPAGKPAPVLGLVVPAGDILSPSPVGPSESGARLAAVHGLSYQHAECPYHYRHASSPVDIPFRGFPLPGGEGTGLPRLPSLGNVHGVRIPFEILFGTSGTRLSCGIHLDEKRQADCDRVSAPVRRIDPVRPFESLVDL